MDNIDVVDIIDMSSEDSKTNLTSQKQTLDDTSAASANLLEIEVISPITHGDGIKRYTDYEVKLKTNLPVFSVEESSVRRRVTIVCRVSVRRSHVLACRARVCVSIHAHN